MSVDESGRRSYLPGAWFGIFGDNAAVLLPPTEKRRVAALWQLLDDGADFDEVLDALIATGLRDLPGFLLVADTDASTRIVVRGAARATFETDEGTVEVEAAGAGTWVERTVTGVTTTTLDVAGPDDPPADDARPMTLVGGLVRVSRVQTPAHAEPAPVPAPVPAASAAAAEVDDAPGPEGAGLGAVGLGAAGAAAAAGAPLSPASVAPEPEPEPQAEPEPEAQAEPEPEAQRDHDFIPGFASDPEPEPEPEPEPGPSYPVDEPTEQMSMADLAAAGDSQVPSGHAVEPDGADDPLSAPAHDAAPDAGSDSGSDSGSGDGQPDAWSPAEAPDPGWGAPQDGPPAAPAFGSGAAPERPQWSPAPAPANPFGPGSDPQQAEQQAEPAPEPPAPAWGGAPDAPAPYDGAGQDPTPADGAPAAHDHDGNTSAGDYDPAVYARSQPGIPGQPPAPSVTARPVARLLLSHGETVEVDRAILVGRAPEARRFTATEQPRLLTVPSPNQEISSTHLEVRPGSGVDHGTAVVTDMGSTNGTVLVQPGLPPEDLQPGIAVQLIPGAVIDMGDGLTIQVANP